MRRESRKKILKTTFGILATPIDLVLFVLAMIGEIGMAGGNVTLSNLQQRLDKLTLERKNRIIRDAIYRARHQRWIKKDLRLTKEGKKRLHNFFPILAPPSSWDGKWYLVLFDIPERIHQKRDILRENLKKLGFAQFQQSVWISAIDYSPHVEKIITSYRLQPYVILAQTDKLGKETSKALANRVWKLDGINHAYKEFISEWKKSSEKERFWLLFKYFSILKRDPQLPSELLLDGWQGKEAHRLVKRYLKNRKISKFLI